MSTPLFDFTDASAVSDWSAIDDRVMGGVSRSSLTYDPAGYAVFRGMVSLERNGGFASVRSSPAHRGLAHARLCEIEVRGDAKQFKISLLTDDGFDSLSYQASFTPDPATWQSWHLPLATFQATFRGRTVLNAPPLHPAHLRQVGLLIGGQQAGPFELHIRSIRLV